MLNGKHNRVVRILVFVLNFICILPMAVKNISVGPVIASIVIQGLLFSEMYLGGKEIPATWYLPDICVADIGVYVAFHFSALKEALDMGKIQDAFSCFDTVWWIIFAVGVVFCIVGFARSGLRYFTAIGGALAGMAVTLTNHSNANLKDLTLYTLGRSLTPLYLAGSAMLLLWMLIMEEATERKLSVMASVKCLLLHVLYLLFITAEFMYAYELSPEWDAFLTVFPMTLQIWQYVLFEVLMMTGIILISWFAEGKELCVDSYTIVYVVTALAGEWVVLTADIPFPYGQLAVLLLVIGVYGTFCSNMDLEDMFSLKCEKYLFVQFGVFLAAIFFLWSGFWTNLIVSAVFLVYFYLYKTNRKVRRRKRLFWVMVPLAITLEATACMWIRNVPGDAYLMVWMMFAVCAAALWIFSTPHPDGRNVPKSCRIAVCVCCGILSVFATCAVWG